MHCCIPERSEQTLRLDYLFFFLAFFFAAILFSSKLLEFSRQQCWRSAYSITMYRDTEFSCQEKSEPMSPEIAPAGTDGEHRNRFEESRKIPPVA